ncbi:hypothetical protein SDC9_98831 [bioreactor metagenome]|uniref:Phosphodiester glycosidase domain-containing protein n=1 Tax=bioreactor metagenome TaxID=1076179 RepID=A0A645AH98_9ZZZZ
MKKLKQTFSLLALMAALLALCSGATAEEAPAYGDLTGDGEISAADAAAMLRGIAFQQLSEEARPDLDFTKNGTIDATDARAALFYACGGIEDMVAFGERVSGGLCPERLFDRFCYTGVRDDGSGNYRSENVAVSITRGRFQTSNYTLADLYLQDISYLTTAFSNGTFGGGTNTVKKMFESVPDAVLALNGDFYSLHVYGPVIRNGVVYVDRVNRTWDIALLLTNGELVTYDDRTLTKEALLQMEVYQSWVFGPALLDAEWHAKEKFRSAVQPVNPRSVLGYYEPGHYAFLAVDGRAKKSKGLTMQELSQLCEELGFSRAYNLDGGQSSVLLAKNGVINHPVRNGRPISDIIAVRDPQPG